MKKWVFSILILFVLNSRSQNLKFKHYGLPEGLPQETVFCIAKDTAGFYWLGTADGIVRFDGHDFYVPQSDTTNNIDFTGFKVNDLYVDGNLLYIATSQNGLFTFNIQTEAIKQIGISDGNCTNIKKFGTYFYISYYNKGIYRIDSNEVAVKIDFNNNELDKISSFELFNNKFYLGTENGELFQYAINEKEINNVDLTSISNKLPKINHLKTIDNSLFICTDKGLFHFDDANKVNSFSLKTENIHLQKPKIFSIVKTKKHYFIASNKGLIQSDMYFNKVKQYKTSRKYDPNTVNSNTIYYLLAQDDLLFIGNINLDITSLATKDVFSLPTKNYQLKNPSIRAVLDTKEYLFTGSSSVLVISSNQDKSQFKQFPNYSLTGLAKDIDNNIWVTTRDQGVYIIPLLNFDFNNIKIIPVPINSAKENNLNITNFRSVYNDLDNQIWLTTYNQGILKFTGNISNGDFKFQQIVSDKNLNQLPSPFTLSMVQDSNKNYWISTQKGLSRMTFKNKQAIFKNYDEKNGLITKGVLSSFVDKDNTLWVASRKGLNKYIRKEDRFISYGKRDGLSNTFVYNIAEDNLNNLWISTNGGLFKFNKTTKYFSNYSPKDGLQSTEFNLNSFFQNPSKDKLYFGGINGLNVFDPSRVSELDKEGNLTLTSLNVKDKTITSDNSTIINTGISNAKSITLKHNDFPTNISFSALDYRPNSNIQYVYKLLPKDRKWNSLKDKNAIQLLNLSPNSYQLQIQGMSRGKLWEKLPLKINLEVKPPWYKSTLAYLSYLFLFLLGVYFIYRFTLQRKLSKQETIRLQELDALKSRFITNITHEFRTPLTIILGFLDNLKEQFSGKKETLRSLTTIEQNSTNLLSLVNQMLDLAKLEQGSLSLNLVQNDIIAFIEYVKNSFVSIAKDKEIKLLFTSNVRELKMDFDAEKVRQIFTNLISNALKFSEVNTTISITINSSKESVKISITDQGYGISADELPLIFDRFYQVNNKYHKVSQGTGVGLALTKELVELMNGKIKVSSQLEKGTSFTIHLPIQNKASIKTIEQPVLNPNLGQTAVPIFEETIHINDTNSILIVEDNADMARYIQSCLDKEYKIIKASNGKKGLETAINQIPDLILTDVMMPVMDGFELTQKLQENEITNHIPIVMLTSKAMQEDKLEGLSSGADAYLTKPFSKKELLLRIKKLIAKRAQLQNKYQNNLSPTKTEASPKNTDKNKIFLDKLIEFIHTNIEDSRYNAKQLAVHIAMSDSQLYRKLKAVTNTSTAVFIRRVRLNKAKELVEKTELTIAEITYATGFNDPNWFGRIFKKEFNQTPTELRK